MDMTAVAVKQCAVADAIAIRASAKQHIKQNRINERKSATPLQVI